MRTDRLTISPQGSFRPFSVTHQNSRHDTIDRVTPNSEIIQGLMPKNSQEWMLATTRPSGPEGSSMVRTR